MSDEALREKILVLVEEYAASKTKGEFRPGVDSVPPSGKVVEGPELRMLVDASLDGWLTKGRFNTLFQEELAKFLGVNHVLTTNSGSSANLLAVSALTSPLLGDRRLKPGDEVITVAAGFPTTVNPIINNGLVPVFVDAEIPTYNIDVSKIEEALSPKTKAIVLAHTLGNPYNLGEITRIVKERKLWLIEDCCDALGSTYEGKLCGTFGDIGTLSFYPAHHITMGEGGAVFTNNKLLRKIVMSFRDWGRDCHCEPGTDDSCGNRFGFQLGKLPFGYDHKYTYSHLGYNLNITDMQAAIGLAQLKRLDGFIQARKANFKYLTNRLECVADKIILPEATPGSDPSWFGYPITLRDESVGMRQNLLQHLDEKKIGTRLLFAGNLTCQPYFEGREYRVVGDLNTTNLIMNNTFWVGIYPGLNNNQLDYLADEIINFVKG